MTSKSDISEAWTINLLLLLYRSESLSLIDVNKYLHRIKSETNKALVDAIYGKNKDPVVLNRLKMLVSQLPKGRDANRIKRHHR